MLCIIYYILHIMYDCENANQGVQYIRVDPGPCPQDSKSYTREPASAWGFETWYEMGCHKCQLCGSCGNPSRALHNVVIYGTTTYSTNMYLVASVASVFMLLLVLWTGERSMSCHTPPIYHKCWGYISFTIALARLLSPGGRGPHSIIVIG